MLVFLEDDANSCRWIETRYLPHTGKSIGFNTAPIAVGPLLRKARFEQFPTAGGVLI